MKFPTYFSGVAVMIGAVACYEIPSIQLKHEPGPIRVKPLKKLIDWREHLVNGVKSFEGYSPHPYKCPAGVYTVGYGHTGKYAKENVNKEFAETLLLKEIISAEQIVKRNVKVKLTEHQIAALTSFTYNCGEANLLKLINGENRLNSGNYESIEQILPAYNKANGTTLNGLKKRRNWELEMWTGTITL